MGTWQEEQESAMVETNRVVSVLAMALNQAEGPAMNWSAVPTSLDRNVRYAAVTDGTVTLSVHVTSKGRVEISPSYDSAEMRAVCVWPNLEFPHISAAATAKSATVARRVVRYILPTARTERARLSRAYAEHVAYVNGNRETLASLPGVKARTDVTDSGRVQIGDVWGNAKIGYSGTRVTLELHDLTDDQARAILASL